MSSTAERNGMAVCGRSGLWVFSVTRPKPAGGGVDHLGSRDSEPAAAELVWEQADWITDRAAFEAVERAAEHGTANIGDIYIALEPASTQGSEAL